MTGANGAGKTNLLEALHVGTQGFSPRTRADAQLVRIGASAARVALEGTRGERELRLEVALRGPEGKLNLRAQNLLQFLEVAAGVDDETWTYHFRRADYSRWFRDVIKDSELAAAAAAVERDRFLSRDNALAALRAAVETRYTLPADAPLPVRGAS